jgi:hypothetical protein
MADYLELLKQLMDKGVTLPEAQRAIHKSHPGLRRRYEAAHRAAESPAEPTAPAATARRYQEVTSETARIASGMTKQQWAERRAAKVQGSEPVSNTSTGDYFQLVRAERQRTGCNFKDAALAINKRNPEAWAKMMERANPGRSFQHRIKK